MYVLDTNTLIYFFKGMGRVAHRLLNTPPKDIGIPAIVLFELQVGIAKSQSPAKRTNQLESLVNLVNVLPFGYAEAKSAARIRVQLEQKGSPIGPFDTLIAGTALAHQAVLVTHNTNEFVRINGLMLEDWY
jgi:tRNA(fMet)-specific endonuclease VapC